MEPMQEKLADGLHPDASFSRYTYLLVIIDTFTEWIQGFPTWSEKAEEVVKKLLMKSLQDLAYPGHYKVTMGHHLLLRSPNGSLKHYLLPPTFLEASVFRKSRKSKPVLKISNKKDNPGDLPEMKGGFTNSSPLHPYFP